MPRAFSDCHGPYISGRALHTYPLFTEEDTYGSSRFPFVDEQGNRRIDYSEVSLPVIERELPMTGSILFRNSYTEEDARDIAGRDEEGLGLLRVRCLTRR